MNNLFMHDRENTTVVLLIGIQQSSRNISIHKITIEILDKLNPKQNKPPIKQFIIYHLNIYHI